MTNRTWTYKQLTTFPGLVELIGGEDPRVFAKKSMTSSRELHPYIVYKLGYNANEDLSEMVVPERQFLQIFVHDYTDQETGDYMRIDEVLEQLKLALHGKVSPEDGILNVRYLETSQDLNDDTLNTVFKYARFQITNEGKDYEVGSV